MKKTVRIIAVLMMVAMLSLALVSCGNMLSGKYSATFDIGIYEATTTYEFGLFGSVTKTVVQEALMGDPETTVTEGKYEIMEDPADPSQLIIAFEFDGEERTTASFVKGSEGDSQYIKIGNTQYFIVK